MKRAGHGFHELPLVLFTALAIAGSGVGTAHLFFALIRWAPWVPSGQVMSFIALPLAAGLLLSTGHLGRPWRGPLALVRVGRSPLSNEVLAVSVAATAGILALVLPAGSPVVPPLGLVAVVASPLVLLSLALVYRLPGQLTWDGPTVAHPLVSGSALGLTVLLGQLPVGTEARVEVLILLVLLADGLLVWERVRRLGQRLSRGVPTHAKVVSERVSASVLRVLSGVLLPAVVLLQGWPRVAGICLFANLFLDRFLFYGFAVRENTEAEVKKVEVVLKERLAITRDGTFPS